MSVALLGRPNAASDRGRAGPAAARMEPAVTGGPASDVPVGRGSMVTPAADAAGLSSELPSACTQTLAGLADAMWESLGGGRMAPCLLCGATVHADRTAGGELLLAACADCGTSLH